MDRPWLPILLALGLISPWPILAVHLKETGKPDRVAIPAMRASFSAPVSTVFSRAKYFLIIDLETDKAHWITNPYRKAKHAAGLRCAYLLLDQGVGVVVAKHIGPEPYSNMSARGVRIFTGHPRTVSDAVHQYEAGALTRVERPSVQIHYGLERQGHAVPPPSGPCPMANPNQVQPR